MNRHGIDPLNEDLIEMTYVFAFQDIQRQLTAEIPFEDWKMMIDDWPVKFETMYENTDWDDTDYSMAIEDFVIDRINGILKEERAVH